MSRGSRGPHGILPPEFRFSMTLQDTPTANNSDVETECRASGRAAPQGLGLATPSWPPGQRGDRGSDDQTPEGESPAESAALRGAETAQVALQGERQKQYPAHLSHFLRSSCPGSCQSVSGGRQRTWQTGRCWPRRCR